MTPDELDKHAATWAAALRDQGRSPNTVRVYTDSVHQLTAWQRACGKNGLSLDGVRGFIGDILDDGGARSTARIRAKAVKQFSQWLASEGIIGCDELAGLKAPAPGQVLVPKLSEQELAALISACAMERTVISRRDEAIIRLGADAPTRAEELLAMDLPGDLDLSSCRAIIRKGKGCKQRIVPYSDETALAISMYLRARGFTASGPLWQSRDGGRLSYKALYATLCHRAEVAGIQGFYPHRLRHTAAVRWLLRGGSEGNLLLVGGWERREMIDHYVRDARAEMALEEGRRIFNAGPASISNDVYQEPA